MHAIRGLPAFAFAAVGLVGCGEEVYRAETVWRSDGRIDRAVFQPEETLPQPRDAWDVVRPVAFQAAGRAVPAPPDAEEQPASPDAADPPNPADPRTAPIRELPAATVPKAGYVAAWGTFDSVAAIPDHLRIQALDPAKSGTLDRSAEVRDLGFATEHVWHETLTDVVTLDDMVAARRETAALLADLAAAAIADGGGFDATAFVAWLRSDAAEWGDELHAAFVEASLRRPSDDGAAFAGRLADICGRHGLMLRHPGGELFKNDESDAAFDRFLIAKVRATVTASRGERPTETEAVEALRRLGFERQADGFNWRPSDEWRRAAVARLGSQEVADAKAAKLVTRLFGFSFLGFLGPQRPFRYELTVPGAIVETTGKIVGPGRVRWTFAAADAFPLGYAMTCRSVAANAAAQTKTLGGVRLASAERLAEYAALVRDDAELTALVRHCVEAGSLQPLEERAADGGGRLAALRRLLAPENAGGRGSCRAASASSAANPDAEVRREH